MQKDELYLLLVLSTLIFFILTYWLCHTATINSPYTVAGTLWSGQLEGLSHLSSRVWPFREFDLQLIAPVTLVLY